jgi:atypical dual specificity phosphatase
VSDALALELRGFGVAFGDRIVLADVTLDLPRLGASTLVGPSGSGKSTLLRTIAGLNDPHPALTTWGTAKLQGRPLAAVHGAAPGELRRGIGFVVQHARFFVDTVRENLVSGLPDRASLDRAAQTARIEELLRAHGLESLASHLDDDVASLTKALQRRLAIARAVVSDPCLLFADEPTADLEERDALDVLAALRAEAERRAVFFVTHNQRYARLVGGTVVLLSGGFVREIAPVESFWTSPATPAGRAFASTGGSPEASPGANPEDLDEGTPRPPPLPPEAAGARSRALGPRNFFWVLPDKLGGLPRPGIVDGVEEDIAGLSRLRVTTLVTLEESRTVGADVLAAAGIASVHFPITDMGVPTVEAANGLCDRIQRSLRAGEVLAVHCLAGLGRTGTILAAYLIFGGETARTAIERVRCLNPRCIQSQAQLEFLSSFESYVCGRGVTAASSGERERAVSSTTGET